MSIIGAKYPLGSAWLERRLAAVERGAAELALVMKDREALAWAILTPKGGRRVKLSTFLVAPRARNRTIGCYLIRALQDHWLRNDIDEAYVSVDQQDVGTRAFFSRADFRLVPGALAVYGADRRDVVYGWRPI